MQYPKQNSDSFFSAVAYADTNDYHWPLLSTHLPELETALEKDETAYTNVDGKVDPLPETRGPFGFGDAIQLNDDKVSYNLISRKIFSINSTLARTDLLCMLNWGTQRTMVSYLKK